MPDVWIDEISPRYLREQRITLTLDASVVRPTAFGSVLIQVSYAKATPGGVVLPLVFEIRGPSEASTVRRVYSRTAPASIVWRPTDGGVHMITLREVAHNRLWGKLRVDVAGESIRSSPLREHA